MTFKRRLDRIERARRTDWRTVEEIPTPELDALLRKAYREGGHSPEEARLYRESEALGFRLDEDRV